MAAVTRAPSPETKPACEIIPFPHSRRIGRARDVAVSYTARKGNGRAAYKQQVRSGLFHRWVNAGLPEQDFGHEWLDFWKLVEGELQRLHGARP